MYVIRFELKDKQLKELEAMRKKATTCMQSKSDKFILLMLLFFIRYLYIIYFDWRSILA